MKKRIFKILISILFIFPVLPTKDSYAYTSVIEGQFQTVTIDGKIFTLVTANITITSSITINNDLVIAKNVTLTTSVGSSLTVNGNVYVYGYFNHYGTINISGELKVHNFKNMFFSGSGSSYGTFLGTGGGTFGSIVASNKQYIPIPLEIFSYSSSTKVLSGATFPVGTVQINNAPVDIDVNGVFNYSLGDPIDITILITDIFGFSNSYNFTADFIRSLDPNAQPINVTGITLNKSSLTLTSIGSTEQLVSTISPSNATNKNVTWISSNEAVATVSATGVVSAVGNGSATITTKTVDGNYQDTAEVSVTIPVIDVTGITLNKSNLTLTSIGSTEQLVSTISPSNATNKNVTWTSSDEAVATVSATGVVSAVGNGSATITTKTVDGNYQDTAEVDVYFTLYNSKIIQISASYLLYEDGNVYKRDIETNRISKVLDLSNILFIASDGNCAFAINEIGEVYVQGVNNSGQLGLGTEASEYQLNWVKNPNITGAKIIKTYGDKTLILSEDGKVYGMGRNLEHILNSEDDKNVYLPTLIDFPEKVIDISVGGNSALALAENGNVYISGFYQPLYYITGSFWGISKVELPSKAKDISTGSDQNLILLDNGEVFSFGKNYAGELGVGDCNERFIPEKVIGLPAIKSINASSEQSYFIAENGDVYVVGANNYMLLGLPESVPYIMKPMLLPYLSKAVDIWISEFQIFIRTENNGMYFFGGMNSAYQIILYKDSFSNQEYIKDKIDFSFVGPTQAIINFGVIGLGGSLKLTTSNGTIDINSGEDLTNSGYSGLMFTASYLGNYEIYQWYINDVTFRRNDLGLYFWSPTRLSVNIEYGLAGDLNLDDAVTLTDLVKLRRNLAGLENLDSKGIFNADLNQDGTLTLTDLVKLRRMLAGLE